MKNIIKGELGNISGVPVFEDKNIPEGTYVCLDKDGIPIKRKDFKTKTMTKIVVHNFETFKMAMKNNESYGDKQICKNN